MKKLITIFTAGISLLLFSCNKSDTIDNPSGGSNTMSKIKTWSGSNGIATYTYDAGGRCQQVTYSDGSKNTYEYTTGKVIQKNFNTAGVNIVTYVYDLDTDGLKIKESRSSDVTFSEVAIYNTDKQIVKFIVHQNGKVFSGDYFYSNGNCDSVRFSTNGVWYSSAIKTYYTSKPNSLTYDTEGIAFMGKSNKNLLKTEQYKYSDGTTADISTYAYEFDEKGRVGKQTLIQGANQHIEYIVYY